ncbi:AAA family ATPase, partial [Rodentibacter trehalosifermentans]
ARGKNLLDDLFKIDDFNNHKKPLEIYCTIQIDEKNEIGEIDNKVFDYEFSIIWNDEFHRVKINYEKLSVNQQIIYERDDNGAITFGDSIFTLDWHSAALPLLISRNKKVEDDLNLLKEWLSSMILIAPVPSLISSFSEKEESILQKTASNFVSWFRNLYTSYPKLYLELDKTLKDIFTDFDRIELAPYGNNSRVLNILFSYEEGKIAPLKLKIEQLSDGEKVLIIASTIIALTSVKDKIFCFWDEPDNYVSIYVVETLISYMKKKFDRSKSHQLFITSHDELVINAFPHSKIRFFYRNSHQAPTRVKIFEQDADIVDLIKFGND